MNNACVKYMLLLYVKLVLNTCGHFSCVLEFFYYLGIIIFFGFIHVCEFNRLSFRRMFAP